MENSQRLGDVEDRHQIQVFQAKDEMLQLNMAQRSSSFEMEKALNSELAKARHSIC